MAALSPSVRLFYIGLWMLADDAGYIRWDADEAAIEIYGYESRGRRDRLVTDNLAALVTVGRVVDLKCGHLRIPTLTDHQRFGGATKRVLTFEREHLSCAPPPLPADPRGDPPPPAAVRIGTGNGSVRKGSEQESAPEPEPDGSVAPTEFSQRVPRPGVAV